LTANRAQYNQQGIKIKGFLKKRLNSSPGPTLDTGMMIRIYSSKPGLLTVTGRGFEVSSPLANVS
jgi:hypothetical protein